MRGAPLGTDTSQQPVAFSTYTRVTLLAPTFIATVYVLFDRPAATVSWGIAAAITVLLAAQQVSWLLASPAWPGRGSRRPGPWTSVPALVLGAGATLVVLRHGLTEGRPVYVWALPTAAALAVLVLASLWWEETMPRLSRPAVATCLLVAGVAAGVAGWTGRDPDGGRWSTPDALITVLLVVVAVTAVVGQAWWDAVVRELSAARQREVDQAIVKERLRFAGELHDLQGHQLQVILLRADLAREILHARGPDGIADATATLVEIGDSARETLRQTREIAHGYRQVSFSEEVRNATEVLRAAGIDVVVDGPLDLFEGNVERLAGLTIREATTNILRHSRAQSMAVSVGPTPAGPRLCVVDPGPGRPRTVHGLAEGSGLAGIADRAVGLGYALSAGPRDDGWAVELLPQEVAA